ncbi:cupin domain-containing protein [Candidatus Uhrbacteria bacterium]|nr:cupin domain-containing protein [Candidatus Uhrbacteria bacterium]
MRIKNLLRDCPEFIAGDATRLRELINPLNDKGFAGRYSLAHAIVEPGKKSALHKMLTSEAYYILEGSGIMHIAEEQAEVGAGDFIDIPPGAIQWIENTGQDNLVFLCIVDPAWWKEDEVVL